MDYPDPPEDLRDAWARFQKGESVTPQELRDLDEWRADVHEDAFQNDGVQTPPTDQLYAILLDVQTDWPEVVFVGTFERCEDFRQKVVTPIVEANGDEAVYYETTAIISPAAAIAALRERQEEEDNS